MACILFPVVSARSETCDQVATTLQLRNLYEQCIYHNDTTGVSKSISRFDDKQVSLLSDSIQYYYNLLRCWVVDNDEDKTFYLKRAIQLREQFIGVLDPEYLWLCDVIGNGLLQQDEIDEAAKYLEKAYVIGLTFDTHSPPNAIKRQLIMSAYARCLSTLAQIYSQRDWQADGSSIAGWQLLAGELYFRAYYIGSCQQPPNNPDHYIFIEKGLHCLDNAEAYSLIITESESLMNRMKQRFASFNFVPDPEMTLAYATALAGHGCANWQLNHIEDAINDIEQAIEIIESLNSDDYPYLQGYYIALTKCYAQAGNEAMVNQLLQKWETVFEVDQIYTILKEQCNDLLHK